MAECLNTPPQKKLKGIPAKQKYKMEYSHKWPVLQKSKFSGSHVYWQMCRADINIRLSGLYDCQKHVESAWHVQAAGKACSKIDTFFSKDTEFVTINAETLFTSFLIEHNIPMSVSDHTGPLLKECFQIPKLPLNMPVAEQRQLQLWKRLPRNVIIILAPFFRKDPTVSLLMPAQIWRA